MDIGFFCSTMSTLSKMWTDCIWLTNVFFLETTDVLCAFIRITAHQQNVDVASIDRCALQLNGIRVHCERMREMLRGE